MDNRFSEIIELIKKSQYQALRMVNTELINLYWNVGKCVHEKIEQSQWGKSIVQELANHIQQFEPHIKGFSDKNIWRMMQFYNAYKALPKLSSLLREISWSHNLIIISRCKDPREKEFYIKLTKQENYSCRELERQISASLFERTLMSKNNLSTALRENSFDLK